MIVVGLSLAGFSEPRLVIRFVGVMAETEAVDCDLTNESWPGRTVLPIGANVQRQQRVSVTSTSLSVCPSRNAGFDRVMAFL